MILQNIEALASDNDESIRLLPSRFLACLPQADLSPAQQQVAAELLKEGFRSFPHPRERFRLADISPWSEMPYEDERAKGWPEDFDQQQLQVLSRASSRLIGASVKPEVVSENLPNATAAAVQSLPTIAANQAALNQPVRFWVLDALEDLLEKHRTAGCDGHDAAPPQALVVGCANLALTILETVPHGITDTSQRSDSWHRPETLWCHALALADSAMVCVPVKDDPVMQARFERVLSEAFQTGNAGVQVAISWSVRPWHWLHSEQRRALHTKLVWQTPRQASVLISSLAATQNESDKNRTAIYRMVLERADIDNPQALAEPLGELCGRYSMVLFSDTHRRSSVADLAREVIDNPTRFPLLKERGARVKFLHSFAFGMKEVAQHHCNNLDFVTDFTTWSLKIWLHISPIRENRQESEGVVLFATHWLETKEPEDREIGKLRIWWQQLFPLLHAVAKQGNRQDCFTLFYTLRDPKMYHVLQARELLDCVESLLRRLTPDVKAGRIDLDEVDQDAQDYNSWSEILRNAAEALESGRAAGLLQNDWQREKSRSLLAIMAAPPFNVETARMGLYHLHTEAV